MAEHETIIKILALFKSTWPNRETNASTAMIYHLVLQDIEDDDLIKAGIACIESCRFWPSPSEIREHTDSGSVISGEGALNLVMQDTPYRKLSKTIQKTLKNIGGKQMLMEGNFTHMRRNFLNAYNEISNDLVGEQSRERAEKLLPKIREQSKLLEGPND